MEEFNLHLTGDIHAVTAVSYIIDVVFIFYCPNMLCELFLDYLLKS